MGPATEADLQLLGVNKPRDLAERDAFQMFEELCRVTGARHDPCVIDVFMAAIDFVRTGESKPWWAFTPERKRIVAQRQNVT